jgi:DnaJ-class molecular chaperone
MASASTKRIEALRAKLRAQVLEGETHYEVLGIPPAATDDMIKGTHRALASAFHPDRCALADAQALMARVNVAYTCLSDRAARRKYDAIHLVKLDQCPTCDGKGFVLKQRGFSAKARATCGTCGGTGCQ